MTFKLQKALMNRMFNPGMQGLTVQQVRQFARAATSKESVFDKVNNMVNEGQSPFKKEKGNSDKSRNKKKQKKKGEENSEEQSSEPTPIIAT